MRGLCLLLLGGSFLLALAADDKPAGDKPMAAVPEDDKLYVWAAPEKGKQSMLFLEALDGESVRAAYLVPVTVWIDYGKSPKLTKEKVDELAVGKLLPVELSGRDRFGRLWGKIYLGKDAGWLEEQAGKKDKPK